jgi:hypothetical protein
MTSYIFPVASIGFVTPLSFPTHTTRFTHYRPYLSLMPHPIVSPTLTLRLCCRRHHLVRLSLHISRIDDDSHARHPPVASDRSLRKLQTSTCRGKATLIIHDILVPQSMITTCGSSENTYFGLSYRASWGSKLFPRRGVQKILLFG